MRDGVSASRVAITPGPWRTVHEFLVHRLPAVSAEDWARRLDAGEVLDAGGQAVNKSASCVIHRVLWYWRTLPRVEPRVPFAVDILHRDEHLLVVDKPPFLPMTPKGRHLHETLLVRLKLCTGIDTLVPVHRLDRETSGVVLLSIRPETRHAYQSLFRERLVHKVYEAVAPWCEQLGQRLPVDYCSRLVEREDTFMQMHEVSGAPNTETRIELIARAGALAHYRLTPRTGRKHQLRAHLNALGIPIVGDRIYPVLQPEPALDAPPDFREPLRLLARAITFTDPLCGEVRRFASRRTLSLAPPAL
jgi:tRNA pseudouridine32 synthase/23S rRNA pseudouridine746 synthase